MNNTEWAVGRTACEKDDIALLNQAISTTAESNLESFYEHLRRTAIKETAIEVLNALAERGVNFEHLRPLDIVGNRKVTKETLDFLLAHGWDINYRETKGLDGNAQPFMWHCVDDHDTVAWCLEHDANVRPRGQEPLSKDVITHSQRTCPQILERVATSGSVATFELLRSKGAPLGWRPLHLAVENATYGSADLPDSEKDKAKAQRLRAEREERVEMVRHLIDKVKIDVNAPDQPAGSDVPGNYNGTPICYIPGSQMLERDTRELTWLLLDRGADPTPAIEVAKACDYPKFIEDVEAWRAQENNGQRCCVQ
ncbi:hypothetical protein ACN47E_004921 [Coniothyrium glycines]